MENKGILAELGQDIRQTPARRGFKTTFCPASLAALCMTAQDNTADEWFKTGQALDRNGSYEEAVIAYNRAIELSPDGMFWHNRGAVLKALGRDSESDAAYASAKRLGSQG